MRHDVSNRLADGSPNGIRARPPPGPQRDRREESVMRKTQLLALLCAVFAGLAGCASKHIVRAAPPSVSVPPPDENSPMPAPSAPPPVSTTEEPAPEVPSPALPPPRPASAPLLATATCADRGGRPDAGPNRRHRRFRPSSPPGTWNPRKKARLQEHHKRGTEFAIYKWEAAQPGAKRPDREDNRIPQTGSRSYPGRRLGPRPKPRRKSSRAFHGTREIVLSRGVWDVGGPTGEHRIICYSRMANV